MRFLLFAPTRPRPRPPRTVLKATTNHYELNQSVPGARARRAPTSRRGPRPRLQRRQRGHGPAAPRDGQATTASARGAAAAAASAVAAFAKNDETGPTRCPWRRRAGPREARPEPAGFCEADFTDRPAHVRPRIVDSGLGPRDAPKARGDLRRRLRSRLVAGHAPRPVALRRRRRARHGRPERVATPQRSSSPHRKASSGPRPSRRCAASPTRRSWNGQTWPTAAGPARRRRHAPGSRPPARRRPERPSSSRGRRHARLELREGAAGRSAAGRARPTTPRALKRSRRARPRSRGSSTRGPWRWRAGPRRRRAQRPHRALGARLQSGGRRRAARPGLDATSRASPGPASAGRADRASYEVPAASARCRGKRGRVARSRNASGPLRCRRLAAPRPLAQDLEKAVVEPAPAVGAGRGGDLLVASGIAAGRGVAFDAAFGCRRVSTFASGEGRALANLASATADMYGDDSGGLADGLDVRRILDAVAALAVPLAEGAALEPPSWPRRAAFAAAARRRRRRGSWPRSPSRRATPRPTSRPRTRGRGRRLCAVETPAAAAAVRALGADGGRPAFPPRLRADLCRALAAVGATDSPFFDEAAPRHRLLPPPTRRTRPTRRGSRSSRSCCARRCSPATTMASCLLTHIYYTFRRPSSPYASARWRVGRARRVRTRRGAQTWRPHRRVPLLDQQCLFLFIRGKVPRVRS